MARIRIDVTAEDIAKGERLECDKCAVALAATRAFGRPIESCSQRLYEAGESGGQICVLPPEAREFVHAFDSGLPVEPFSFEVHLGP